jgi:D-alanyl-D-alanine carboxypeptidase (penicillin-binding protein 5/6)
VRRARGLVAALAALTAFAVAPAAAAQPPPAPDLDARSWVLVDARTGDVLAGRGAARSLPVASATKLMTAYVAISRMPLRRIVRAAPYAAIPGESLLGLRAGQRVSVRDLLYGLILESGNDAAYTLAVAASGSEPRFVRQMNLRAAALGLADTHYGNPIGLDEPGNYSSARDLVALTRRLYRRRAFRRIAAATEAKLPSLRPPLEIDTRNTLLHRVPWANGVKTGHTLGAGYVLVGSGRRNGVELISAVLGAPSETSRDLESLELLDYGFSLYRRRHPVRRGQVLARPEIRFEDSRLALRAARAVTVGARRGQALEVGVRAPDEVEGPIRRGRRLGTTTVTLDGRRVAVVPLLAARSVEEAEPLDKARSFAEDNAALIGLGLCGILLLAVLLAWTRRRRSGEDWGPVADQIRTERDRRRADRERRRRERDEAGE